MPNHKLSASQQKLLDGLAYIGWTEVFKPEAKSAWILQKMGLIRIQHWPNDQFVAQRVGAEDLEIQALKKRMDAANEEQFDADKAVEAFFRPRVEAKLEEGDLVGAQALANRMPDCVALVFILDTIHQAKGKP